MNRFVVFLAVAILGFMAAFMLTRSAHRAPALLDAMPELEWLRQELQLNDTQLARAAELHRAYRPHCEDLCTRILRAREEAASAAAASGGKMTPTLSAALDAQARVHADCQKAMIGHLYETAAIMNPEQAKRYLDATLPHALNLSSYESLRLH